ncbi:phosphodiester glycosidase family protein [Kitasatospora sp. NBC_01287]|uniref:phosphodiester glycosidase family protein n=1 Tax=Kitasatospora sp. NBC_01287 TaxID=2903573 RepID=UPI002259DBF6|nr:phosphodiester glycosidase family protein [Kitasatospora sp. NBC_01287]MCX4747008.1 phosphodiester glycosidase family protein [Kitasatospora sp. NBC_01287]
MTSSTEPGTDQHPPTAAPPDAAAGPDGPDAPEPAPRRAGRTRRLLRKRPVQVVLGLFLAFLTWLSFSIGGALLAPGNDSAVARIAEWARDHHLGPMVTGLETAQYKMNPPKVGGRPTIALNPGGESSAQAAAQASAAASLAAAEGRHPGAPALAPINPAPLVSPAGDPLPGEGVWHVIGNSRGVPSVQSALLRPDSDHTSYLAAVVSMDQRLLRFQLHPGTEDPGPDDWGVPPNIPADARGGLLASFNGGFKVAEAQGGFYLNGVTHGSLRDGAASLVFYKDGHTAVGSWGDEVSMEPDVVGVRQNLRLIVDHGAVPDDVDHNVESGWGLTIGGKFFVWRSGAGVTADGRLVYVYGPALSVRTLADLLHQAGCVQAMQLDINPAWMSYNYYQGADPASLTPTKLLPDQERPADRYFEPTSRDFTAVYAR